MSRIKSKSHRREVEAKTLMNNTPVYVQKNRKKSVTVRELAKKYFSEKTEMKNHRDAYLKYFNIIDPEFGHRDIYTVQISEIRNFRENLKLKYRPASVNYYLAQFKAIINYAMKNDLNSSQEVSMQYVNKIMGEV